jgi:hypothetical protein
MEMGTIYIYLVDRNPTLQLGRMPRSPSFLKRLLKKTMTCNPDDTTRLLYIQGNQ